MSGKAVMSGIYTLTATHCGTGQAAGAVDLPIARESTTGIPILPGTSLKGVARDAIGRVSDPGATGQVKKWFGTSLVNPDGGSEESSESGGPGSLVFGEGFLLAYPLRSLNRPLLYGTSRLLIERWARLSRAHQLPPPPALVEPKVLGADGLRVLVGDASLKGSLLVVEDQVIVPDDVRVDPSVEKLGQAMAELLPSEETSTKARLQRDLIVLPDSVFGLLIENAPPVTARIQLTSRKTTSEAGGEKGNLWYEEALPSDCLFGCIVAERTEESHDQSLEPFLAQVKHLQFVQIGGNETVGQGRCWWSFGARS